MKKLKFFATLFSLLLMDIGLSAQTTSPTGPATVRREVSSIDVEQLSSIEYKNSAARWNDELSRDVSNESAWINLYKASRYEGYSSHSRKLSKEKQLELDAIISKMNSAVPASFALHYAKYLNASKTDESFAELKEAYKIKPLETELLDDMLCDAVINKDNAATKQFAELLSKSNLYNAAEVEYNRNVLNSIEQKGILITNGNVDTYPLIMMQQLQGYRTDVGIVCVEWLNSKKYQEEVKKLLDIKQSSSLSMDQLLTAKSLRPVYVALTMPPDFIQKNSNKLFCTGLAMKYSKSKLENLESLAYNWESLFVKSRMNDAEQINRNYLFPVLMLKEYYSRTGNAEGEMELQQLSLQMAQRFKVEKQVKKHLD